MNKKTKIENECKQFFEFLIERTGTYFLSDYVEDIIDYVGEKETKLIVKKRNQLIKKCEPCNIDFHNISCDVASKFINV
jgi:hypothetical protein